MTKTTIELGTAYHRSEGGGQGFVGPLPTWNVMDIVMAEANKPDNVEKTVYRHETRGVSEIVSQFPDTNPLCPWATVTLTKQTTYLDIYWQ